MSKMIVWTCRNCKNLNPEAHQVCGCGTLRDYYECRGCGQNNPIAEPTCPNCGVYEGPMHVTKPGDLCKDLGIEPDELLTLYGDYKHKYKIARKALDRIAPADNPVARWAKRAIRDIERFESENIKGSEEKND